MQKSERGLQQGNQGFRKTEIGWLEELSESALFEPNFLL